MLFICSMDISSDEDERTLTIIDPCFGDDQGNDVPSATLAPGDAAEGTSQDAEMQQDQQEENSSKSAEKNKAEILKKSEDAFSQLTSVGDLETFLALQSRLRVMVSTKKRS